jgi:hypothetical protein
MFIYTIFTVIKAVINTAHCSRILATSLSQMSVLTYPVLRAHNPDYARTQHPTPTALSSSTFILSLNTRPKLRRSTTSSVPCEHRDRSLVNTGIPRYPPAVSPWHGSIAIRSLLAVTWLPRHPLTASRDMDPLPSAHCLAVTWLPRHPLTASLWHGSLTICSLPRRDMAPSPSAHCLAVTWLPRHPLTALP